MKRRNAVEIAALKREGMGWTAMGEWTATTLYCYTAGASSVAAFGSLLLSNKTLTPRLCLGCVLFHAPVAGSIGMVCYEGLGFKQWRALGIGVLYAAGIIHISSLQKIVIRSLGGSIADNETHHGSDEEGNPGGQK